ncbi:MAG: DUF692 domain-containing protein [Candidatus Obscuribacterales bacterium]|jgi:uncharacterized protein (UPF0276 family)|nr:DUF692 domain-containing protein [Candidatus Obscuribacterales bacterium]
MASSFLKAKSQLPTLGVGLGLRRELATETFAHSSSIDWLEIVPENYMEIGGAARERLDAATQQWPIISHGINLSIGSTDELNTDYLKALKVLIEQVNIPWFSDHLCFTSFDGIYLQDLLPLPFSKEAVKHIVERIKRVQDFVGRPFLIENISFYMHMPGCELPETEFMTQILEEADCGLLLDVNNVYVNSLNHGFDPVQFVNQLPLERVVQIHVAGHKKIGDYVIDTHGAAVVDPVFDLLAHVLSKTKVNGIMLERDQNFPDFAEIIAELDRIREIASVDPAFQQLSGKDRKPSLEFVESTESRGRELRALSA